MANPAGYKTLSVPAAAYEELARLRDDLAALGDHRLPDHMREELKEQRRDGAALTRGLVVLLALKQTRALVASVARGDVSTSGRCVGCNRNVSAVEQVLDAAADEKEEDE